jgi:hypothetical protein
MIPRPHKLTLVKPDGTKIPDIWALIQSNLIWIDDHKLPIEKGDTITRHLPNGSLIEYTVLDPGLFKHPDPHYCVDVKKISPLEKKS